jgi:hypothetical protein
MSNNLLKSLHISKTDDYVFALDIASKLDENFANTRVVCSHTRWECTPDGSWNCCTQNEEILPYVEDDNIEIKNILKSYLTTILPSTYLYKIFIHDDSSYRTVSIYILNNNTGIDFNLITFVIPIEEDKNGFTNIMFKGNHDYPSFIVVSNLNEDDQWVDTTHLKKGLYN